MRCGAELDHATPLMIAAGLQQAGSGVLDVLIKAGAEVNAQADGGETALMEAAKEGNEESASFLLNHGADPTIKDSKGRTALDKAEANKVGKSLIKLLKSAMKARANNK
jgi:ankyrin repeat protein